MELPTEVIQHIFSFLDPSDIVRQRQVSKRFRDISCVSALWRGVYANARLLLPPGPYAWQSTKFLERTLVESELVSRTWTSKPFRVLRRTVFNWKDCNATRKDTWTVAFGRWFIFVEHKTLQCHDLDTDARRTIYDGTTYRAKVWGLVARTRVEADGRWLHILLMMGEYSHKPEVVQLLTFRVDDDGLSQPGIMDCFGMGLDPLVHDWRMLWATPDYCNPSPSSFLVIKSRNPNVVLDLRTRRFYKLKLKFPLRNGPQFNPISTMELRNYDSTQIIVTRTHIVAICADKRLPHGPVFIQTFVVPDIPTSSGIGKLRVTHEAIVPIIPHQFTLLRNSIVDPVDGSTNIRLLNLPQSYGDKVHVSCLELVLPRPTCTTDVLPIHYVTQKIFEHPGELFMERYTTFGEGHVRGILGLLESSADGELAVCCTRKYAIDASEEHITASISEPGQWVDFGEGQRRIFCGLRGRVHYNFNMGGPGSVSKIVTQHVA